VAIAWAYLIVAGLCEVGWPIGLKWTQEPGRTIVGAAVAVISLAISGGLLFLAQRDISLGTSYAVWTGIGARRNLLGGGVVFRRPLELRALARRRAHHRRRDHAQARALSAHSAVGAQFDPHEPRALPLPACGERSRAQRAGEGGSPQTVLSDNPPHPNPLPASGERERTEIAARLSAVIVSCWQ
jgi:quaternary ammonium compound-resistance protein SugE